jgi:ADP-heptose:LPS heptosyltransferase
MEEEIQLMSHLKLMISMDSGNAHMAAMMGVKVITLWGVTHPFAGFKPFNQPFSNCLLSDRSAFPLIPTSIYGNIYPKNYENAIASIPESEVLKAIKNNI